MPQQNRTELHPTNGEYVQSLWLGQPFSFLERGGGVGHNYQDTSTLWFPVLARKRDEERERERESASIFGFLRDIVGLRVCLAGLCADRSQCTPTSEAHDSRP